MIKLEIIGTTFSGELTYGITQDFLTESNFHDLRIIAKENGYLESLNTVYVDGRIIGARGIDKDDWYLKNGYDPGEEINEWNLEKRYFDADKKIKTHRIRIIENKKLTSDGNWINSEKLFSNGIFIKYYLN